MAETEAIFSDDPDAMDDIENELREQLMLAEKFKIKNKQPYLPEMELQAAGRDRLQQANLAHDKEEKKHVPSFEAKIFPYPDSLPEEHFGLKGGNKYIPEVGTTIAVRETEPSEERDLQVSL